MANNLRLTITYPNRTITATITRGVGPPGPAGADGADGTGSGGLVILESADATKWVLGVTDDGALTTTPTASDVTAGEVMLSSPDGTVWDLGVTNNGALTTTAL